MVGQDQILAGYLLLGRLAQGGMAEVFLARSLEANKASGLLALKRILPQHSDDSRFASMFLDEVRIAGALHHPHIGEIFDHGTHEGQLYQVMEFVHGKDLRALAQRLRGRRDHERSAYRVYAFVLARVAEALDYAHSSVDPASGESRAVVHRDVTPSNIIVSYDGVTKLIDFGIARAASRLVQTDVGVVKGKTPYMSPEHARGAELDGRSDLFSLGAVLYELLTGRPPFRGKTNEQVLQKVVRGNFRTPRERRPEIPESLDRITCRLLASDPADRFQNGAEVAQALTTFIESGGRAVGELGLSAFMRRLFRETYIREKAQLAAFLTQSRPAAQPLGDDEDTTLAGTAPTEFDAASSSASGAPNQPFVATTEPPGYAPLAELSLDVLRALAPPPGGDEGPESPRAEDNVALVGKLRDLYGLSAGRAGDAQALQDTTATLREPDPPVRSRRGGLGALWSALRFRRR